MTDKNMREEIEFIMTKDSDEIYLYWAHAGMSLMAQLFAFDPGVIRTFVHAHKEHAYANDGGGLLSEVAMAINSYGLPGYWRDFILGHFPHLTDQAVRRYFDEGTQFNTNRRSSSEDQGTNTST